jgi:hypothetical protein
MNIWYDRLGEITELMHTTFQMHKEQIWISHLSLIYNVSSIQKYATRPLGYENT